MSNIVIFGATQSGKTTLLGYLATSMLHNPQFNEEVFQNLKLIKNLTTTDEFSIGNPYNPINVNKDIILPSFISLDKDELRKFRGKEKSEGSTKRIHRKQLTICMSERDGSEKQNENENVSCIFLDMPGFRQRLSDKYFGFFEGDVGIAVLKLQELVDYHTLLLKNLLTDTEKLNKDILEMRLFEPIRIWCDYRSSSNLVIAISQIDRNLLGPDEDSIKFQIEDINNAITCIRNYTHQFDRNDEIPISPISIKITDEANTKSQYRMARFFHRKAENIYEVPKDKVLPGNGTFISCLKRVMPSYNEGNNRSFSMASIYRPMKAKVNAATKTALNVHALHGTIHKTDKLMLGPIIDKRDKEIIYAQCDISSIKADGAKETSDILLEGNAGGIIFNSVKVPGTRYQYNISFIPKESDIAILKSTILYKGDILQGDIIQLEINRKDHMTTNGLFDEIYSKVLPSIMPFDQLFLFWYGKKVSVNVVEINYNDDKIQLSIIISKGERESIRLFTLPCQDGRIKYNDDILLAIPRSYYSSLPKKDVQNKYVYVSSTITDIKNSFDFNAVEIYTNTNCDLKTMVHNLKCHINNKASNDISYTFFVKSNNKNFDIYSLLIIIGRNIHKMFNREVYRQIGGAKVTLLKYKSNEVDIK